MAFGCIDSDDWHEDKNRIKKLEDLLTEVGTYFDHDDDLPEPFAVFCRNSDDDCIKCRINKELLK